jgi:hypothetical protein
LIRSRRDGTFPRHPDGLESRSLAGKGRNGARARPTATVAYLRELFIEVNLVLSLAPSPFTTEIIASEMPAAIRPYSIAVAPVSSRKNLEIICIAYHPVRFHQKVLLDKTRDSLAAGSDVVPIC